MLINASLILGSQTSTNAIAERYNYIEEAPAINMEQVDAAIIKPALAHAALPTGNVESFVRTYFADIPIMAEVARCESRFRHTDATGNLLRGMMVREDVGVMQINETYHLQTSKRYGLDIHTLSGNLEYAKKLYEQSGLQPWKPSSACWGSKQVALSNNT